MMHGYQLVAIWGIALSNLLTRGDSFVLSDFSHNGIRKTPISALISTPSQSSIASSSFNDEESELSTLKLDCHGTYTPPRRDFLSRIGLGAAGLATASLLSPFLGTATNNNQQVAQAAPPIAVIAEELGYFPVQNRVGDLVYVPKRVQRESSDQAIELAKKMSEKGAVMYGAFWCPHCARQKELLGREAFQYITYVECAPKGFGAQPLLCNKKDIDGYPTWVFKDKTVLGGERPLEDFANQVKDAKFNPQLEQNVPPSLGSSTCK